MDEFALIDRYFRRSAGRGIRLGIGDDAAVMDLPDDCQLVCAVDTSIESVHFPADLDAADAGFRAVAVNLSDLAAMGARPAWMTLALSLPDIDEAWLEGFAAGLFAAADEHCVALVGGDTTRASQIVISVQLLGYVATDCYLTRSGCRAGDSIYVTGTPGDAAAGLELWQAGRKQGYLQERFRRPTARVKFALEAVNLASAAIDVSDGLAADLGRLLRASGVGATLEKPSLPLSAELRAYAGDEKDWRFALAGGDDYELCLTVASDKEAALRAAADAAGVRLSRIGIAEAAPGLRLCAAGEPLAFDEAGYRHF